MLGLILFASAHLQAPPPAPPPPVPDWRYEFTRNPVSAVHSTEWQCEKTGKTSTVAIRVRDVGVEYRNRFFKIQLLSLRVDGRQPRSETLIQVRRAFASLNNVSYFQGACRHTAPSLEIKGFAYDGTKYNEKRFTIDLR